jgi:guanylate kinase
VISGPSGVGKSTVIRPLLASRPNLTFSVSCTTRPPRSGEVDGRDYRFVSDETFSRLVDEGSFLEWAEVFGNRYGTLLSPIVGELDEGHDVLLEVDVQGARAVRDRMPEAVLIFLAPPSERELLDRLRRRATESEEERTRRVAAATDELAQAGWFDHVVVNDDVEGAAAQVAAIIEAESVR